jgi:tetratricopeptide (TPR) repeat protein
MRRILLALVWCLVVQACGSSAPCLAQALDAAQQQEVDALTKQIEASPKDYSLWAKRAIIYRKASNFGGAEPDIDQALLCNPNWQQGYIFRARYLEMNGKRRDAIAAMNRAEEIAPLEANAIAWRGDIHLELKDYKDAISDYSKAIEREPNDYMSYASRACAKWDLFGPTKDAEADLEKSISINPSYKRSFQLLNEMKRVRQSNSTVK